MSQTQARPWGLRLGEPGEQARVILRGHRSHRGSSLKCVLTGGRSKKQAPLGSAPQTSATVRLGVSLTPAINPRVQASWRAVPPAHKMTPASERPGPPHPSEPVHPPPATPLASESLGLSPAGSSRGLSMERPGRGASAESRSSGSSRGHRGWALWTRHLLALCGRPLAQRPCLVPTPASRSPSEDLAPRVHLFTLLAHLRLVRPPL